MATIKQGTTPRGIRSLAMWMIPPSQGWRRKSRGTAGKALVRPLAVLGIVLLMVGFVGLLIMQQSTYNAVLFQGIGDLHRQARYIAELSSPPVDTSRLRYVLDEFNSRLTELNAELKVPPLTIDDRAVPWQASPAQQALDRLTKRWKNHYRSVLHVPAGTPPGVESPAVEDAARALADEINQVGDEMANVVGRKASLLFLTQVVLLLLGAMVTAVLLMRVNHQLLEPLAHLRNWASRMRGGNLSARIPAPSKGDFSDLARDINALGGDLQSLTRDMDNQVKHQTERLAQKTHSLQILYDVASSLNTSRDLDELLTRFLRTLIDLVGARAATVRLLTNDGQMRLVASFGLETDVIERERLVPVERCLCGQALTCGEMVSQPDMRRCTDLNGRPLLPNENMEVIAVPLQYRDKSLGVYNLFLEQPGLAAREDMKELLTSIGKHLGMAVEKARLDTESKRLSIIQERTMLAHELHDSLAQTLASLRFQAKMMEETLEKSGDNAALREMEKIKAGIDEAHAELRELLVHFRARMDERGLIPALEDMVERFRRETGVATFFHNECQEINLSPEREVQVLHIIQEALSNIRKHSEAHTVRVLLNCGKNSSYRILVEDDGQGLSDPEGHRLPGEHLGLSIMRERARRLGGTLRVESEPGEGTRVELTCAPHLPESDLRHYEEA